MDEILVNTITVGHQHQPAITEFLGLLFIVVWADASDANIKGQMFAANGNRVGGEFVVNKPTPSAMNTNRQLPAITLTASGFVVAWVEQAVNIPGPRPQVRLQMFDRNGQKIGPEVQVGTTDIDPKHRPAIASMIDGGIIVTWVDAKPDRRIRAQRFTIEGSKVGPEFTVNTAEGFHESPIVTRLVNGNYVIAWSSDPALIGGGALIFRIFDLEGTPIGGEIKPNLSGFTSEKAMTSLDSGRFVIAHVRSTGVSDLGVGKSIVEWKVFETDGAFSNIGLSATSGHGITASSPALAPLPGGQFMVAWVQKSAETLATSPSVRVKVFSETLGSVGQEVQVNTTTTGDRFSVCAATIFDSGELSSAFVAWADASRTGGDTSDFAVRGRTLRIIPSIGASLD